MSPVTYKEMFNANREWEREMLKEGRERNAETLSKFREGFRAYSEFRRVRILRPYKLAWWEDVSILTACMIVIAVLLVHFKPYMWGGYLVLVGLFEVVVGNHLREDNMRRRMQSITRCPRCMTEGHVVYARHGYEYDHAWVNSLFHVPGARYSAGIRHNYTDCLCKECGYRWTIPVDYRFLNK